MTERRNYSNTAVDTTITGGMTTGSTSFVVATASGYPPVPFSVVIESEAILVGETTGTTFKALSRGYDETLSAAHASGSTVAHKALADDFDWRLIDVITQDDALTEFGDEFDDDDMSAWTQVTPSGTATWTKARGKMSVLFLSQDSSDCAANLLPLSGLTFPLYLVTAIRPLTFDRNYLMAGPVFSDGTATTSNCVWFMPYQDSTDTSSSYITSFRSGTFANIGTTVSQPASRWTSYAPQAYLRLDWVATNTWRYWGSVDGVSWSSLGQTSSVASTLTPTHFGLGVSSWGDTTYRRQASFDMFRAYTTKPTYWQEG
jgi:hypothetical protein